MITAHDVQKLLATKHAKDVYVSECKTGQTWGGHLRLDGWAMAKSWANPMVTGYEIKVSRSDFLQDTKYLKYAKYCNALFLVAPAGILFLEELPPGVGFYLVSKNCKRFFCKRKAVRRDDPIPEDIYRYILMARAQILPANAIWCTENNTKEYFEQWLETREYNKRLGHMVSRALGETIQAQIEDVRKTNDDLERKIETYKNVVRIMDELGVTDGAWNMVKEFRRALNKRINGERDEIIHAVNTGIAALQKINKEIGEIEERGNG